MLKIHVKHLSQNESEKTIKVINAASNFEISIGETLNLIIDIMNADVNIITEEKGQTWQIRG